MTVKELKEKLEDFDDDLEVVLSSEYEAGSYLSSVTRNVIDKEFDPQFNLFRCEEYAVIDDKTEYCCMLSYI